jgi:hypothetical protein
MLCYSNSARQLWVEAICVCTNNWKRYMLTRYYIALHSKSQVNSNGAVGTGMRRNFRALFGCYSYQMLG